MCSRLERTENPNSAIGGGGGHSKIERRRWFSHLQSSAAKSAFLRTPTMLRRREKNGQMWNKNTFGKSSNDISVEIQKNQSRASFGSQQQLCTKIVASRCQENFSNKKGDLSEKEKRISWHRGSLFNIHRFIREDQTWKKDIGWEITPYQAHLWMQGTLRIVEAHLYYKAFTIVNYKNSWAVGKKRESAGEFYFGPDSPPLRAAC